jgi:hypothetical protein
MNACKRLLYAEFHSLPLPKILSALFPCPVKDTSLLLPLDFVSMNCQCVSKGSRIALSLL